ncbi:unnamed protein product [Musa textilis]
MYPEFQFLGTVVPSCFWIKSETIKDNQPFSHFHVYDFRALPTVIHFQSISGEPKIGTGPLHRHSILMVSFGKTNGPF